jgi:hypothetical protein
LRAPRSSSTFGREIAEVECELKQIKKWSDSLGKAIEARTKWRREKACYSAEQKEETGRN